ncbi:hypothetical protein [Erwinia sorbitola]|uniref:Topoisomerase II n=1 Tax=Erwinia sorbitola TaxID=2681984 RepID=A0A6I6EJI9_9GAMM|nr:hypothetical protein [Erwinia sorbitola]MTD28784.1 hypothetical protein [Erwinia sorbitola]QGU86771.1 hypothetical protein GN242_05905 [Erwinia sorbitola]
MISHAILASLFSALVWLVAVGALVKCKKLAPLPAILLFSLPLLVGNLYYYGWISPEREQQAQIDAATAHLARLPVWRTVKEQQPGLYQQAYIELVNSLEDGVPEQQAIEHLRPLVADLLNQRINAARDEDLNSYMQISLEEMKQMRQRGASECFRFLFPQVKGGVNVSKLLPEDLTGRELQAMDLLLKHSGGVDQPIDLKQGRVQLQAVVRQLYERWGSDLQTLNTPAETGVNEAKLCDMTIDLYQSVLALPDKDSANVLRIIISGTGS